MERDNIKVDFVPVSQSGLFDAELKYKDENIQVVLTGGFVWIKKGIVDNIKEGDKLYSTIGDSGYLTVKAVESIGDFTRIEYI